MMFIKLEISSRLYEYKIQHQTMILLNSVSKNLSNMNSFANETRKCPIKCSPTPFQKKTPQNLTKLPPNPVDIDTKTV